MKERLNYLYPLYYTSTERVLKVSVILAVIILLFMLLFTPFNINYAEHRFSYPLTSIIFGLIDGFVFFVLAQLLRKVSPKFVSEENWTILRELGLWALILLGIGVANFFLREFIYINPNNLSIGYLLEEIIHSYLFGLLAVSLLTLGNFTYLIISKTHKATDWNEMIQQINDSLETLKPTPVTITAASEQDKIDFDLADFIYAHVDGNYVEFFLLNEDGNVECHIKRNTLKNVEEQLEKFGRVLRVHRSYLVNCNYIAKVEGNAQGYRLTFPGVEEKVAVSRRYISRFDNVMNG